MKSIYNITLYDVTHYFPIPHSLFTLNSYAYIKHQHLKLCLGPVQEPALVFKHWWDIVETGLN